MNDQNNGPSLFVLGLFIYPFATAAVAVNLYMLTLAWQRIGLPVFSPAFSILVSLPIGIPVTWLAAKWLRRLLKEAED